MSPKAVVLDKLHLLPSRDKDSDDKDLDQTTADRKKLTETIDFEVAQGNGLQSTFSVAAVECLSDARGDKHTEFRSVECSPINSIDSIKSNLSDISFGQARNVIINPWKKEAPTNRFIVIKKNTHEGLVVTVITTTSQNNKLQRASFYQTITDRKGHETQKKVTFEEGMVRGFLTKGGSSRYSRETFDGKTADSEMADGDEDKLVYERILEEIVDSNRHSHIPLEKKAGAVAVGVMVETNIKNDQPTVMFDSVKAAMDESRQQAEGSIEARQSRGRAKAFGGALLSSLSEFRDQYQARRQGITPKATH